MLRRTSAASLLLLASCALGRQDVNEPIDGAALRAFQPGATKAAEVVAALGAPTEVVQLGRRSAYRYDATRTKSSALFLGVINFGNQDARQDRVWLFFDDKDVLLHYGATLSTHRTQYALPWEDVHEPEDHAARDAKRAESGR
ncbi:MAG: hypothetical protein FJ301_03125 [Planctomycetes bacterium]|nr:hypothetical protein [Planctomycetota bacterium]